MAGKVITCAFCEGSGKDPFGIPSELSLCQVCGGRGSVTIREPWVTCAFCGGRGVHRDQRLTCTCCGGKGVISVREPREKCPRCQGTGAEPPNLDYLPCVLCKGAGVITVKKKVAAAKEKAKQPA
jgi:DnaJ-class molecular chaperone